MSEKGIKFKNRNNEYIYPCPFYPIGSIYISTSSINPANYFGGTWESFGAGRCLVGVDTSQSEFNSVQKTGGSKTHKHISPLTWYIPSESSSAYVGTTNEYGIDRNHKRDVYASCVDMKTTPSKWNELLAYYTSTESSIQPYITVYMWRRTA